VLGSPPFFSQANHQNHTIPYEYVGCGLSTLRVDVVSLSLKKEVGYVRGTLY